MTANFLKAKQTKFTAYVTVYILVVIGALGVVNFLANRHNYSLDTTANKRFSLSDQTEKVVKGLKADVKITYFDQSARFSGPGSAKDLLDRYDAMSTKLSVDYVDPDKKPQVARAMGVRSYGTTFIEAMGRKEEAKSVTEEEITGALVRALKGGTRNVCAVKGTGEKSFEESGRTGFANLKDLLERNNYKTREISLLEKAEIAKDCTVVLVGGPKRDYPEPQVNAIKAFVEGGGRALFLVDPPVKFASDETDDNAALAKVLEGWGVTAGKNLVLDVSAVGQIFGLGPEMPLVTGYESHQIVREMKETATAFPIVRALEVKNGDKTSVDKLFSTSGNSYATEKLNATEIKLDPAKDKKGPFVLGAAGTYNTGKEKEQGRFVVVGTSGWVSNTFLKFGGNRDLVMNMFNWRSSD